MSTLKRVVLSRPEYTKNEQHRMKSVHRCFLNAMPDEGLPDLLKMNDDFTLSTHHIDEIHTKKGTWIAEIKEHGFLQTEADAMIGHLCSYMNVRWKRKFGRQGNTNDPYNLVCYEFLNWLSNTLAHAPCNQNTLSIVQKRCDYLNNLLNSGAFKPGRYNKKTMRSTLIRVKNVLEGRVTLAIKREIANSHAREHLESLQNFGKIILSNGFRFLYHIFNGTENTPPPNITRFRRQEEDYRLMCSSKIGKLLTALVDSPDFSPFFIEEHQKKGSSAVSALDTINTSGTSRKVSLRTLQTSANPFLDSKNTPCIPRSLIQNQSINDFLNPPTIPKQSNKDNSVGIYLPIQENPTLIEAYVEMHAILIELAKIFLACDEAKALAGLGGDLLVYGISNNQTNLLMDTLTKLCTKLSDCQKTLVTLCDQIYEPLTHQNKTTDTKNINWVKNYEKIASLQRKLEQSIKNCIAQASLVKEKANTIPKEERLKHAQSQTRHFAQSTEQLNHQVEYFLKRLPTPALPSQQSSWKSATLKHTQHNSTSTSLPSSIRVEVLEEEPEEPSKKQLMLNFRTSLTNVRNMLRNKNTSAEQDSETTSTEPKPKLDQSLRKSNSKLSGLMKQTDQTPAQEAPAEQPESNDDGAPTTETSPRKQLHTGLRKSLTKLLKLTGSGKNSTLTSTANSTVNSASNSAQNSPLLSRARQGTTSSTLTDAASFASDPRKIQRGNSTAANGPAVTRERSTTFSGKAPGATSESTQLSSVTAINSIRKKGTDSAQDSPSLAKAHTPSDKDKELSAAVKMIEPRKESLCKKIEIFGDANSDQYIDDCTIGWTLELLLRNAPHVTEIHLQRNKITGVGAVQLCELLSKHDILEKLICSSNINLFSWINSNDINCKGWAGAKAFCNFISSHHSLRELNISECGLTSEGAKWIAKGLNANKTLEFLDLSSNKIEDDGFIELCNSLHNHPSLQHLMIMGIQLSETGWNALCDLLENNSRITFIGFDPNIPDNITVRIHELLTNNRRQNTAQILK